MDVESKKKRLYYIAHHRGTKEADIIIGRFTDFILKNITDAELKNFNDFLQIADDKLINWYFKRDQPTPKDSNPFITTFINWHHDNKN
jgi:antitoxin CptB